MLKNAHNADKWKKMSVCCGGDVGMEKEISQLKNIVDIVSTKI